MPSYEHKKIVEEMKTLDMPPSDHAAFATWLRASAQLDFLRQNAHSDELVIYGSSECNFIYAAVVPNALLGTLNQDDLLHWNGDPFRSIASYIWGGGRNGVWMERNSDSFGSSDLKSSTQLVFGRTFEGLSGTDRTYFEINQEYTHVSEIHWRPEQSAYCRFDENGDLEHVVSITSRDGTARTISCVSFAWRQLEQFLIATDSTLIRRFDFTLMRSNSFNGWSNTPEMLIRESDSLLFHQKIDPAAAYTTGVQLIAPMRPRSIVFEDIRDGRKEKQYVEFITHDWRNNRIEMVSTDPIATTNYFEAKNNQLPFELSPAFFKPEVILKYKTDKEKYIVDDRHITCRAAWELRSFDVNEAGQVFAYIGYLRNLPYAEQLHWKLYNERPKSGISERALINDFKGEFTLFSDPLSEIQSILRSWSDARVSWWILRDERLMERVSTPLTSSRDEWAEAFMDLSKLVVEGFVISVIREKLEKDLIAYEKQEQSIALLERLVNGIAGPNERKTLDGLRTVQRIRTIKGHASGTEADILVRDILAQHESFTQHFKVVCKTVVLELQTISDAFT